MNKNCTGEIESFGFQFDRLAAEREEASTGRFGAREVKSTPPSQPPLKFPPLLLFFGERNN